MIYNSVEVLAMYDFLKFYFRMCTNVNNYVPVRQWFDDENDMMAQFKQDLYNKNLTLQDQGKDDPIVNLENKIKFWPNIIHNDRGPVPDNLYDYVYNNEGLDETVHGAEITPDRRELIELLDILRSK